MIAADTRMSDGGYGIMTREKGKCVQLTTHVVLASGGMQADIQALHKNLAAKMQWFEFQHRKEMPLVSVSQLLSTTLYQKRFFPYYAFNVLGGVDSQTGEGKRGGLCRDGSCLLSCNARICVWVRRSGKF